MIVWLPSARALLSIGRFTIYWYGLLYVIAFIAAYFFTDRLQRYRGLLLTKNQLLELIIWGAIGVVIGGRLGYVVLYEPLYYLAHPLEVAQLSQGGMSSHGGFVGVAVALWWWAGRGETLGRLLDVITVPAGIGLALGRLGNVINQELYITTPARVAAIGAPLLITVICYWHLRQVQPLGTTTGLLLILYSAARLAEEFFREQEWWLIDGWLSWGQIYTIPLLLIGVGLWRGSFFAVWFKR